jgi:hypothetical protein
MRQSMHINNATGHATSHRVIDEIVFHASMMALHSAIEAASNGEVPVQGIAAAQDDRMHVLVERVRGSQTAATPLGRQDLKGF